MRIGIISPNGEFTRVTDTLEDQETKHTAQPPQPAEPNACSAGLTPRPHGRTQEFPRKSATLVPSALLLEIEKRLRKPIRPPQAPGTKNQARGEAAKHSRPAPDFFGQKACTVKSSPHEFDFLH
jgi:hypothetical protein